MRLRRTTAVVALAIAACAVGSPGCSSDAPAPAPITRVPEQAVTTQLQLRNDMRKLWTDHVTWTRVYLMAAIAGLPDADAASRRLLRNQIDIGNAIKPFYGDDAGGQLAALLRVHILGAVDVLVAAKAGDMVAFNEANAAWYANGHDIAAFLASANPHLRESDLQGMMDMHLDQTLAEATARMNGDWAADVAIYDGIVAHILHMADALAEGIEAQFPGKVADDSMTSKNQGLHLAMRKLWEDHVTWTRVFLISAIAELPDTDAATARLLQNQVDLGEAIKPFYGEAAGDQLAALLRDHILIAAQVVAAAKAGGSNVVDPKTRWYANADEIASFLADANPHLDRADLQTMMHMHLDQTLAEATARLTGKWTTDAKTYDVIVDHILVMSDALSDGVAAQFPDELSD